MTMREDVYCPACPDPDTAFRLEDVGMKFSTDGDFVTGNSVRFTMTRPAWEVVMLEHLRSRLDDDEHRRLYDLCVTELMASGVTAEESARDSVKAAVESLSRSIQRTFRPRGEVAP